MIDRLVGTPKSSTQFSVWMLANAFMPTITDVANGRPLAFDNRFSDFERHLRERRIVYQTIFPIQGASFQQERIELSPELTITRLTPDETVVALETGILPTKFRNGEFKSEDSNSFALKRITNLPFLIGRTGQTIPPGIDAESMQQFIHMQSLNEMIELQQCIALLTSARIQFSGQVVHAKESGFLQYDTGTMTSAIPVNWQEGQYRFSAAQCDELAIIWKRTHSQSFEQNKALALALRRLAFGAQRHLIEDRLLDVFIAAEALYLADTADTKERGELKFRLSLRAAVWSENTVPGWTKRDVFQHMKLGYDLRSSVAHGGEPKKKDIKIKNIQASLTKFVQATEDIVRGGLRKAINQMPDSGRLVIPWDDLVLPAPSFADDQSA
jgi:hypothetical protein